MTNILVATLGATWQLVPELVGFTNPGTVDLYAHHPEISAIRAAREAAGILPVDELWMITTTGDKTAEAILQVQQWHGSLVARPCPRLRIWRVADARDLNTEDHVRRMAEAIYRLVLHAAEQAAGGQLLISLAGGRKTMSSDMQHAASLFGCHALLHVIQNEAYFSQVKACPLEAFLAALPADLKDALTPLVVGRYDRNPTLDLPGTQSGPIRGADFPVDVPQTNEPLEIRVGDLGLSGLLDERTRDASFLYCNHANRVMGGEMASNFLALYTLPPSLIQQLKERRMGVDPNLRDRELAWLRDLPKADLHCHLGGVASPEELLEMAGAVEHRLGPYQGRLAPFLREWEDRLARGNIQPSDFKSIRTAVPGVPEPLCTAAFVLLFRHRPDVLEEVIYGALRDEGAFCGVDFKDYERLGDLQGSGLLQAEECLRAACRVLVRKARQENVLYLEVRCSPVNYTRAGLDPARVVRIIDEELGGRSDLFHSLIISASRHGNMSRVHEHVELADGLLGPEGNGFPSLRGFDLAGNETAASPGAMREAFMRMMEKCMHFTIHAGETDQVNRIWEAVYHLNAERIGHGLTLRDNPVLMERFRDRNIAIEMCPSSNFQIKGFRDNHLPRTSALAAYPLKAYLDQGLRVTVNTDNPGISRTDLTRELHRAARLTPGGLSLWEILLLIRNGFKAAFTSADIRQRVLLTAESGVIEQLREGKGGRMGGWREGWMDG